MRKWRLRAGCGVGSHTQVCTDAEAGFKLLIYIRNTVNLEYIITLSLFAFILWHFMFMCTYVKRVKLARYQREKLTRPLAQGENLTPIS